jgi:hypothetical protein
VNVWVDPEPEFGVRETSVGARVADVVTVKLDSAPTPHVLEVLLI